MKHKVFIDGKEGTTGLRIYERLSERDDIELILISDELRKDINERKRCINESDITFLCLPDAASIEAVSLIENDKTKIIDASTAHRTNPDWVYGLPELDESIYNRIKTNRFIANPGCHASGFNLIVYPLVKCGIIDSSYNFVCNSITGYSGGGKKMIQDYESTTDPLYMAPRLYAMGQKHKHLKEMMAIPGLQNPPIFNPIVANFYSGMLVSVGFDSADMKKKLTVAELHKFYSDYYGDSKIVKVMPFNEKGNESGFLSAVELKGYDNARIYVCGNDERMCINVVYDNLGKGASGAAVECMNIMLGADITKGLVIKE